MLPATMAMMIPMMLGRRKRDLGLLEHLQEVNLRELATKHDVRRRRPIEP